MNKSKHEWHSFSNPSSLFSQHTKFSKNKIAYLKLHMLTVAMNKMMVKLGISIPVKKRIEKKN